MSSKSLVEKIKQESKKPFKICYKCYQDLEEAKLGEVPDCCNDCELFQEWVKTDIVFKILSGYSIIPEQKVRELADLLKNRYRCPDINCLNGRVVCLHCHRLPNGDIDCSYYGQIVTKECCEECKYGKKEKYSCQLKILRAENALTAEPKCAP